MRYTDLQVVLSILLLHPELTKKYAVPKWGGGSRSEGVLASSSPLFCNALNQLLFKTV